MQIEIKPNDIDDYVKDAVLKSSIGSSLEKAIKECMEEIFSSYNSPIKKIINDYISVLVREFIGKPENLSTIQKAIANVLIPETIEKIIQHGVRKFEQDIKDSRDY